MTDQHLQLEPEAEASVAEGMAFAARDIMLNGPIRPTHRGVRTITKEEYNKLHGTTSQKESKKIAELETKVSSIEAGISAIMDHLKGRSSPEPTPPNPPPIDEPETTEPDRPPTTFERPPTARMSLGVQGGIQDDSPSPLDETPGVDLDDPDDSVGWDDIVSVPDEPETPRADQGVVRLQRLVEGVAQFMQTNDVHKFFRRHVAGIHRNLGYNNWDSAFRGEFDSRLAGFLKDSQFVTSMCRSILRFEGGECIGEKQAASFIVATAGFTAFALCGIDS
jgi:hypothetical protein